MGRRSYSIRDIGIELFPLFEDYSRAMERIRELTNPDSEERISFEDLNRIYEDLREVHQSLSKHPRVFKPYLIFLKELIENFDTIGRDNIRKLERSISNFRPKYPEPKRRSKDDDDLPF